MTLYEIQWQTDGVWSRSQYTEREPREPFTRYRIYGGSGRWITPKITTY